MGAVSPTKAERTADSQAKRSQRPCHLAPSSAADDPDASVREAFWSSRSPHSLASWAAPIRPSAARTTCAVAVNVSTSPFRSATPGGPSFARKRIRSEAHESALDNASVSGSPWCAGRRGARVRRSASNSSIRRVWNATTAFDDDGDDEVLRFAVSTLSTVAGLGGGGAKPFDAMLVAPCSILVCAGRKNQSVVKERA